MYKKCQQNTIKKPKKYYKEKHAKTIKIFLKMKKTKNASIPVIEAESFLQKMNLVKKTPEKRQYERNLYKNPSEEKKDKRREYAREKYRNLSEEEKDKRHEYAREKYRNLSEEEKDKKRQCAYEQYKNLSNFFVEV